MLFNFKKSKEVVLNCYTMRSDVFEYSQPKRGIQSYPEWWKKLPKSGEGWDNPNNPQLEPDLTMKSCPGFIDLFKQCWTLPLWADLRVVIGGIGTDHCDMIFADRKSLVDFHNPYQYGQLADPTVFQHAKLISPWLMFCSEDVKWAWLPSTWHTIQYEQLELLSAVADYKSNHVTHINFFIKRLERLSAFTVPFGTPLQYLVPLTERPVKVKCHLVSQEEYLKLDGLAAQRLTFLSAFRTRRHLNK